MSKFNPAFLVIDVYPAAPAEVPDLASYRLVAWHTAASQDALPAWQDAEVVAAYPLDAPAPSRRLCSVAGFLGGLVTPAGLVGLLTGFDPALTAATLGAAFGLTAVAIVANHCARTPAVEEAAFAEDGALAPEAALPAFLAGPDAEAAAPASDLVAAWR